MNRLRPLPTARLSALAACALASAALQAQPPAVGEAWPVARLPGVVDTPVAPGRLPGGPLTLFQLTDLAIRANPQARAAWAFALEDVARVAAALALRWPTVTATVPLTASHGSAPAPANGAAGAADAGGTAATLAPSLGLSWVLLDGGARASAVEAARWQAAASQLTYNRTLQTIVNNVEQAYYALLVARQLQASLEVGVAAAQSSAELAQAKRRAGLATLGETSQAEAALGQARLQLVQAQATARSAAGTLANAVGVPVSTDLPLAGDDRFDALAPTARLDDLLQTARVSRADLVALGAQVRQAEAEVAAAQAQGRPSLSLGAAVSRHWTRQGGTTTSAANQQVGLTLTVPIFDGGLVRAQTQAARAHLQALTAQHDLQRQAVDLDVWQGYQAAQGSDAAVAAAEASLRAAAIAEDAARERYRSGVGLLLELLIAQNTAAQARASLVQARYDGLMALSRLGYALGGTSLVANRPALPSSNPAPPPGGHTP